MRLPSPSLRAFFLGVSGTLAVASTTGLLLLGWATGLPMIAAHANLQQRDLFPTDLAIPAHRSKLKAELIRAGIVGLPRTQAIESVLRWTMSQTSAIGNNQSTGGWNLLQSAREGRGFLCGDLADLFRESLLSIDIPARRVVLLRGLFDTLDSHVAVEVWNGTRWEMYDPTFHVVLETPDLTRVDAQTAQRWFVEGAGNPVTVRFLGDVPYPVRTSTYPIRYETLFNNVLVESRRADGLLRAVPLIGPFFAPRWHYQTDQRRSSVPARTYELLYWTLMVFMPLGAIAALAPFLMQRKRS